ncbi:MAG: hypothetical protein GQ548_00510 [Methylophaga sp.]|nr:hypothetical protein [Methylophaga sp.]
MKNLLLLIFLIAAAWKLFVSDTVELGPGVKVLQAPIQQMLSGEEDFDFKGYQITRLASFALKAKILSKEAYSLGRESDLSPVDLALGWQNMSDEKVLTQIDISQSNRWYHWHVKQFPIPRKEIETQSANMHLIPANDLVEDMIDLAKQGQIIEINGSLIRAEADDNWHWQSSLTRDDTGAHACELVYVDSFNIIE